MRILAIQESDWLERGPHQSHHLLERLSERGHEVRVIDFDILWHNRIRDRIVSKRHLYENIHKATDSGKVTVIRPSVIRLPLLVYLSAVRTHRKEIIRQFQEFKPNVIVCFGILNAFMAIRWAKKNRVRSIYYVIDELHSLVPEVYLRGVAGLIERWNMRNAGVVISINVALRQYTQFMGASNSSTKVIGAGVDIKRFDNRDLASRDKTRQKYGIGDQDVVLFYMGWLYKFSGVERVARELMKRTSRSPAVRLLIVGEGESWLSIQKIKRESKNGDLIVLEKWKPYAEIPGLIKAADICILPAECNEIMKNIVPIKMYEYMAAAKPVISTRLPGIVREFGNDSGIVYASGPDEVLDRVDEMLKSDSVTEIGIRAKKAVSSRDWVTLTEEFESTLIGIPDDQT